MVEEWIPPGYPPGGKTRFHQVGVQVIDTLDVDILGDRYPNHGYPVFRIVGPILILGLP